MESKQITIYGKARTAGILAVICCCCWVGILVVFSETQNVSLQCTQTNKVCILNTNIGGQIGKHTITFGEIGAVKITEGVSAHGELENGVLESDEGSGKFVVQFLRERTLPLNVTAEIPEKQARKIYNSLQSLIYQQKGDSVSLQTEPKRVIKIETIAGQLLNAGVYRTAHANEVIEAINTLSYQDCS